MKSDRLTIVINDPNLFFATGLAACLSEHLLSDRITPAFTDCVFSREASTMFIAAESLSVANCHYLQRRIAARTLDVYILRDRPQPGCPAAQTEGADGLPTLYRHSSPAEFAAKIQHRALPQTDLRSLMSTSCSPRSPEVLTRREAEILRYLARGISNGTIARLLHISEKTVSAHKRNIMTKFNMIRPAELNYWLLQEGWCESWSGRAK